jgi:predicted ATPase/class 3 adenylate cyclase/Tfp pilus assembly protein PilF
MSEPAPGHITLLFTDIEGSTRLWEQHPHAMPAVLARHDALLSASIAAHQGRVFKQVGDGFYATFADPAAGVAAALAVQHALQREDWHDSSHGEIAALRVRIALHQGPVEERDGDYFGPTLNRIARMLVAGHGGQILLSQAVAATVQDRLPPGSSLRDLGARRLKDLHEHEHIFQVVAAGLPADFPPLRTVDNRPTNLPAQRTALVGRAPEVALLCTLLRRADVRLITLIGPGGIGKTRLSLEAAAEMQDEFEHGTWFVALDAITSPALVIPTIARVLNVAEVPGQSLETLLQEALHPQEVLLVLDNFEHVGEAAPQIAALLDAAPRLKVLVSSREELYIYGEYVYPVPPLALTDPAAGSADNLAAVPAVALFAQRAQAARFDFTLTPANAPIVAAICTQIDGLPLAIELAAAHVRQLTLAEIRDQITHRLTLLTAGPRDRPTRQQSLRGAIAWSYDLLTPDQQQLFARLAVFAGGWTVEAAAALVAPATAAEVARQLEALVAKSLLRHEAGPEGAPRFGMLATIREYAAEQLAAGDAAATARQQHADYYLALVEQAAPDLAGPQQAAWFVRLRSEQDNLRAALTWTLETGAGEMALRLGGILWRFWSWYSDLSEGRQWLETILAQTPDAPPRRRALAWHGAGRLAMFQGDYATAERFLEQSLALYRQSDDSPGLTAALNTLGDIVRLRGDREQAATIIATALARHRAASDMLGIARSLHSLGQLAHEAGDHARAVAYYEESLALRRQLGSGEGIALSLSVLGDVLREQGDERRATALYEESLTLYRAMDHVMGVAATLQNLGYLLLRQGQPQRAESLFQESLRLLQERSEPQLRLSGIAGLGGAWVALGRPAPATHLLGAVAAGLAGGGLRLEAVDHSAYTQHIAAARAALGEAAWAAAWAAGEALSLDEACALAQS